MREGETLATHYASADLFLFPSLTETFGNVVLEAMASGLAVVAFDYAAARAHLNSGRDGLSVPFGDKAAFVSAAVALAREPARLENLGRAARQSVERLDSERIYDRLKRRFCSSSQENRHARPPLWPPDRIFRAASRAPFEIDRP